MILLFFHNVHVVEVVSRERVLTRVESGHITFVYNNNDRCDDEIDTYD